MRNTADRWDHFTRAELVELRASLRQLVNGSTCERLLEEIEHALRRRFGA